ncbi:MAG: hypothetical protein AABX39_04110 [Nanoarchaeota archaeon]
MATFEIGKYALAITIVESSDGTRTGRLQMANDGADEEIVIMKLKSLVKTLEQNYFKSFNSQ